MFCDQVKVKFIAGKGGDGCVSFRREKYVAKGGPDGGDGGNGGNIVLVASSDLNTLSDFNRRKVFKASDGKRGMRANKHGADACDLVLKVPCGTIVYSLEREILTDLVEDGERFVITRGGRGGKGNASFVSSVRQAPDFAELGDIGEEKEIFLELKLISDVGLIGLPSAGKSTLISKISRARPKIADYPFTTLIPNLGVVDLKEFDKKESGGFVVADIPGLIEGAGKGKGLGHEFLRHIGRTRVLVHLLDVSLDDLVNNFKVIDEELAEYDKNLAKKPQIVVLNKIDLVDDETVVFWREELREAFPKLKGKILAISAVTGSGVSDLVFRITKELSKVSKKKRISKVEKQKKVFRPGFNDEKRFEVTKKGKIFYVEGKRIEQIVRMTNFSNDSAVARVYDVLDKMNISRQLVRSGAKSGDMMRIAGREIKFLGA